jgi:hypothetical protein
VDGAFLLDDAALRILLRRLGVTLDHHHAFDHHAIRLVVDAKNLAALALLFARDHHDGVALAHAIH